MNIIIIEDEPLTANDLADTIKKVELSANIVAILKSVKEAKTYLTDKNPSPDLVFCDIQLGDGACFEIFKQIDYSFPIIFCTAYDEYALEAFKVRGIDYLLKPFSEYSIANTLKKYHELKYVLTKGKPLYDDMLALLESRKSNGTGSVLVFYKDKIFPVRFDDVALFYIENEITYLRTTDNRRHTVNKTLEELERLAGENFYRANRQILINRKVIKEVSQYFSRKLSITLTVPFDEKILIRKEKVTDFLKWLSGN